jgi:thioredoxin 1
MIIDIKSQEEFNQVIEDNEKVLVDFWAQWCGPCKMVAPALDQLNKELDNVIIAKVDIDNVTDVPEKYGVRSIPTLLKFENGSAEETRVGFQTVKQLKDWMQ